MRNRNEKTRTSRRPEVCVSRMRDAHLSIRYYRRDCYDSSVDAERSISRAPIIFIDNRSRYV